MFVNKPEEDVVFFSALVSVTNKCVFAIKAMSKTSFVWRFVMLDFVTLATADSHGLT